MARKNFTVEQIIVKLREVELHCNPGKLSITNGFFVAVGPITITNFSSSCDKIVGTHSAGRRHKEDTKIHVSVAQLDRALDSDSKGQRFESSRARPKPPN